VAGTAEEGELLTKPTLVVLMKAIFSPSGDHAGDSKSTSKFFVSVALMSLV
jgi:hypothetical protein